MGTGMGMGMGMARHGMAWAWHGHGMAWALQQRTAHRTQHMARSMQCTYVWLLSPMYVYCMYTACTLHVHVYCMPVRRRPWR